MKEMLRVAAVSRGLGQSSAKIEATAYETGWLGLEQENDVITLEPEQLVAVVDFARKHDLITAVPVANKESDELLLSLRSFVFQAHDLAEENAEVSRARKLNDLLVRIDKDLERRGVKR